MQSESKRRTEFGSYRFVDLAVSRKEPARALDPTPVAGHSLHQSLARLLDQLHGRLTFEYLGIATLDPASRGLAFTLQAGDYSFPSEVPIVDESLKLVVDHHAVVELPAMDHPQCSCLAELLKSSPYRCLRVLPLVAGKHCVGAMFVARKVRVPFSEDDANTLQETSHWISLALEGARVAELLAREQMRLHVLLHANAALASRLDPEKLLGEISKPLKSLMGHEYSHLLMRHPDSGGMKTLVLDSENRRVTALCEEIVSTSGLPEEGHREPKLFGLNDLQSMGSPYVAKLLAHGIRSLCFFPLVSMGRNLGGLGLSWPTEVSVQNSDEALLNQIAAQFAFSLDTARAYDEIARLKEKLSNERLYVESELNAAHPFGEVVGKSHLLRHILRQVEIAAPSDANVLVLGETGTGKELVAQALHRLSARRDEHFMKVNCAAIPTGLLESELFGHEKGAFTGAISQKLGKIELADKGTLFLDEIGEIPMELQPKLLRVLQDHEFERLGGVKTIKVNVRVVAATNRNLAQAVADHQFRSDLFYRLNVFPIQLPPLRERIGDISMLVQYFVQKFARRMGKCIESIPTEILRELERWHWPGNVRELENFIERSVILTQGPVLFAPMVELKVSSPDRSRASSTTLEAIERDYVLRILRESRGIISGPGGAAARLGMKRTTLQSRIQKLGITRDEYHS